MTAQELYNKAKPALDAIGWPERIEWPGMGNLFLDAKAKIFLNTKHAQSIIESHLMDCLDGRWTDWQLEKCGESWNVYSPSLFDDFTDSYDTRLDALLWACEQVVLKEDNKSR